MNFLKNLLGTEAENGETPNDRQVLDEELNQWAIVTADNQVTGENAIFRIRESRPSIPEIRSFTRAISISWRYDSDSGMPSPETKAAMDTFEDAIDKLTWFNGFSELMYVATGGGDREWLFYSSDQERFMSELNELLAGHPAFPLEIEFYDDPEWRVWGEIAEAISERESVN